MSQQEPRGAEYLTSDLLTQAGFRHAFFLRTGGVSEAPYASLNFAVSVGDQREHVEENLRRAARVLRVAPEHIYFLSQVHGVKVETVTREFTRAQFCEREGDAVISREPLSACGVRSADCVPILLGDRKTGVTAAVHAGWRGVALGAVTATLKELGRLGIQAHSLVAAIGPHISADAFEVSEEVAAELLRSSPDPNVVYRGRPRPYVDLRRIVRAQLQAFGLTRAAIDDVHGCTVTDASRYFSFRREGKVSGRHLSAIVPNG